MFDKTLSDHFNLTNRTCTRRLLLISHVELRTLGGARKQTPYLRYISRRLLLDPKATRTINMPIAKPQDPHSPVLSHFSLKGKVAAVRKSMGKSLPVSEPNANPFAHLF